MRQQEFDTQEVLAKAMDVFREKGYKGASLKNLLDEMGIGKGSFYATFGSKRNLFLEALKRYGDTKSLMHESFDLLEYAPAKIAVRQLLDREIDRALGQQRACLFGKAGFEFWQSDPEIAKEVSRGLNQVEDTFKRVIERGQNQGDVSANENAKGLARFYTGVFYGIQVMSSINSDRQNLEDIVSTAMSVLDR